MFGLKLRFPIHTKFRKIHSKSEWSFTLNWRNPIELKSKEEVLYDWDEKYLTEEIEEEVPDEETAMTNDYYRMFYSKW